MRKRAKFKRLSPLIIIKKPTSDIMRQLRITDAKATEPTDTILSKSCYESFYKGIPTKHSFSYEKCI